MPNELHSEINKPMEPTAEINREAFHEPNRPAAELSRIPIAQIPTNNNQGQSTSPTASQKADNNTLDNWVTTSDSQSYFNAQKKREAKTQTYKKHFISLVYY